MHAYFHTLSLAPWWFRAAVAFCFGAIFASFICVVGERVPRHETLGGRSHCVCGADLGFTNIPILGWLLIRGKARCCGAKVPIRYFLIELALALAWAASAAAPLTWPLRLVAFVLSTLIGIITAWQPAHVLTDSHTATPSTTPSDTVTGIATKAKQTFRIDLNTVRDDNRVVALLEHPSLPVAPQPNSSVVAVDEDGAYYDATVESVLGDGRVYLRLIWATKRSTEEPSVPQ